MVQFYCIPTCSTCAAARKWLQNHEVEFEEINLKLNPPAKEEMMTIMEHSKWPRKRFFNTSGTVYKEKELKNVVSELKIEAAAELLAGDGMLIKRPLIIKGKQSVVGFKTEQYEQMWQKEKERMNHDK